MHESEYCVNMAVSSRVNTEILDLHEETSIFLFSHTQPHNDSHDIHQHHHIDLRHIRLQDIHFLMLYTY